MAQQTIQIADKPTLDATKENTELLKEMASQSSGGGVKVVSRINEGSVIIKESKPISTLPYTFYNGCAVVYNNEIHILGSNYSDYATYHYKWDGTSWTSVSTLPYTFYNGSAVVYNNEIHILGGSDSTNYHYKWNGTSWTFVNSLPCTFYNGSAVVYNNEIHILGSNYSDYATYHYKWDGTSWTKVSTLPYTFYNGCAVVYNNEIHILGSHKANLGNNYHYKWDGISWTKVSTLPRTFYDGCAVVYNNEIHILGGFGCTNAHYTSEYTANSIQLYLQSGSRIICDIGKIFPISDNLEEAESGYICTQTGLCKLSFLCNKSKLLFTII